MAQNPYVNKVQNADGTIIMDISNDTVTPSNVLNGATFHDRSGAPQTGVVITQSVKYNTETITTDNSGRAYIGKPPHKILAVSANNTGYWCYTRYADNGSATLVYVNQLNSFTPVTETSITFSYSYID